MNTISSPLMVLPEPVPAALGFELLGNIPTECHLQSALVELGLISSPPAREASKAMPSMLFSCSRALMLAGSSQV